MTVMITYDPQKPFLPVKAVCPKCGCSLLSNDIGDIKQIHKDVNTKKAPVYGIACPRCEQYGVISPESRFYAQLVEVMKIRGEWR